MIIFSGSKSTDIGWEVSKKLKGEQGKYESKIFPDGEYYFKSLTNVSGKEVAVIQTITSNDDLFEIIQMIDCLKDNGATQVHAIMPYLAYMRQDKRFNEGEALTAKTVLKMLDEFADSIATINCHFLTNPGQSIYNNIQLNNLDAIPELVKFLKPKMPNPIAVAVDKGSLGFARQAAELLDCDFNHIEKTRISGTEVRMKVKNLDVKGKDVIMLDDIISTGGTIVEASKIIKRQGAKSINVGCVHGLFLNGIDMFAGSVDKLVATNSINSSASKTTVSDIIVDYLN